MDLCVFEVREAFLGAEHPDTLTSVSNLAMVLAGSGEVRGGRGDEPASAGGEREGLGKEHPDALTSIYCLAFLFHQQRQYKAASALYERAGSGYQRVLGLEHPTTIACSRHYSSPVQ